VTPLPAKLRPWAPQLGLFHRELAIGLAPWIQRLATAIGPLGGVPDTLTGDPDGYDGVTRRGPYERLLPTEWLFADAAPEEFLRRAAGGEHQFYRLALQQPKAARRCLVLFDAGPSQLGTPRIAHLAALVVFASRCAALKAELHWGTLQGGPVRRQEGFSRERAERLLDARSPYEATAEQLRAWLEDLQASIREANDGRAAAAELSHLTDDLWLVGGAAACALPAVKGFGRLEVIDVLAPDARRVDAVLRRPGKGALHLELALPPPPDCVRLLRSPFADPPPPPQPLKPPGVPMGGRVFSFTANRLHSLGAHGELLITSLPERAVACTTRHAMFQPPPGEQVVAAGWHKGPTAITARFAGKGVTHFVLNHLSRRGSPKRMPQLFVVQEGRVPELQGRLLAMATTREPARTQLAFSDGLLTLQNGLAIFAPMQIIAAADTFGGLAVLSLDSAGRRMISVLGKGATTAHLEGLGPLEGFFGQGQGKYPRPIPLLATSVLSSEWTLHNFDHQPEVVIPAGSTVMAVTGRAFLPAGLLVRSADGLTLSHHSQFGVRKLAEGPSPILNVAVDLSTLRIAWLDATGALSVIGAEGSKRILRGVVDKGQPRFLFSLVPE
jgi:hypothetical protein